VFRRAIQDLVLQIVPQTNVARASSSLTNDELRRWRVERRVASDDARPWYLTLAIPGASISQAELRQIINSPRDSRNVDERIMRLASERTPAGVSRIRALLNRLVDLAEEPEVDEWGTALVTALHRVVDRVLQVDVPRWIRRSRSNPADRGIHASQAAKAK